ncbi:site-specific integrase [Gracilimonas sediminicola]|uniref:site-specific integrase n=1 Tax=Gracilimonas sediminicola TaxID=2952158 RepID=UPI0038D3ABF9
MFKNLNITYTIRTNKARSNGEAPIYLRLNVDGKTKELSSGEKVLPEKWESNTSRVKGRSAKARLINAKLETLKFEAKTAYQELLEEGTEITSQAVKDRMTGKDKEQQLKPLLEVFQLHNTKMEKRIGNSYSEATHQKYKTCKMHLESFLEGRGEMDFPITKVDLNFLEDFAEYLMTKEKPCSNNTTKKYLTNVQKVINFARRNDWLDKDPFQKFEMSYEKTDTVFLTHEEVKRIYHKEFEIERLERVRDVFIFACYTGFAFSDTRKLKKSDVQTDMEGGKFLQKPRTKTHESALVPLLPIPLAIIEKYEDDPQTRSGNLLPVISNQNYNAYLKEVATLCGIQKHLTTHVARHTCGTLLLNAGLSMESVRRILGHADLRMTLHYAKLSQTSINGEMAKLSEKLS